MSCISFKSTCPSSGDEASVLLAKILQVLNDSSGGGGGGVTSLSVNGGAAETGAVSITVPATSDFLLKAGDTGTGPFLLTPSADDVVPLTLTSTAASATGSNTFVVNYGADNLLSVRNDGRLTLNGRVGVTTASVLGNVFQTRNADTAGTALVLTLAHRLDSPLLAANGFGLSLDYKLDDDTTANQLAARELILWEDAATATRKSSWTFSTVTSGGLVAGFKLLDGQIGASDGSAAAPAYTNRNSTFTTGMYFPTTTTLGFSTAGVQRLQLVSTGALLSVPLSFSGTGHAGITLNNLTTAQRTALTPAEGNLVMDTDLDYPLFYNGASWVHLGLADIVMAVSDETTVLTSGLAKLTFRMPFAMVLTTVKASLTTTSSSGNVVVDINESGSTVLGTKLTVDAGDTTSVSSATTPTITDANLAADAVITIDIDSEGTGATGLKVTLTGYRA